MITTSSASVAWDFGRGLHGYAWRVDKPKGNVLLQHGYAEHAGRYVDHYSHLVPRLMDQGLSVYAFDMRGHGLSPGARAVTDVAKAVEAHLAARQALNAQKVPLWLFGHSLGGLVTAASVARDSAGVSGVVLSSPALLIQANAQTRFAAKILASLLPSLKMVPPQSYEGLSRLSEEIDAFVNDSLVYRGKMPAALIGSAITVSRQGWARYANWDVPTITIHGAADTFADVRGSILFNELIVSEDKTLIIVPEGRHELLNDVGRESTVQIVIEWISAHTLA